MYPTMSHTHTHTHTHTHSLTYIPHTGLDQGFPVHEAAPIITANQINAVQEQLEIVMGQANVTAPVSTCIYFNLFTSVY